MNSKGFTLIELLVVIAIIGVLVTFSAMSLSSARSKSRDARRVSDIKQLQSALEMYFNDQGGYPAPPGANECGTGFVAGEINNCCLSSSGGALNDAFSASCGGMIYSSSIPDDPNPAGSYMYYQAGADSMTYQLVYSLENAIVGVGDAGQHTATPNHIANP